MTLPNHPPGRAARLASWHTYLADTTTAEVTVSVASLRLLLEDVVEGATVTEWGVVWADGETTSCGWMPGVSESFARKAMKPDPRRIAPLRVAASVATRERTWFSDVVTDWTPVEAADASEVERS